MVNTYLQILWEKNCPKYTFILCLKNGCLIYMQSSIKGDGIIWKFDCVTIIWMRGRARHFSDIFLKNMKFKPLLAASCGSSGKTPKTWKTYLPEFEIKVRREPYSQVRRPRWHQTEQMPRPPFQWGEENISILSSFNSNVSIFEEKNSGQKVHYFLFSGEYQISPANFYFSINNFPKTIQSDLFLGEVLTDL